MERLVTSNEAAQLLNLSLQGVHYRIKQDKLKSVKKDGKTFVYINDNIIKSKKVNSIDDNINNIILEKDEQIILLKKSLKWIKKQYQNEIYRLEQNQNKIIDVFKSEINLLQSAFNEMRNIYKIEHLNNKVDIPRENVKFEMMDIKDFFILMKQNNKSDIEIKSIILSRIKQGDNRFIFNKDTKEVMIYKSDFVDLI